MGWTRRSRGSSGSSGCQGPVHKDFQLCLYCLAKCGGTTEGRGLACGARTKNLVIKSRDRASAWTLYFPGTCTSWIVKLLCAATKNSSRSKTMRAGSLDDWPDHAWTTARLSQWKMTRQPSSLWCQVPAAARMAKSSCHWMEWWGSIWWGSQDPLHHDPSKNAPKPWEPDASVKRCQLSALIHSGSRNMARPFQEGKKRVH